MADIKNEGLTDVAILTKSIESVIRNLIKILIGKISLLKLEELIERIFVEESETYIRSARPGRDVPLTKLALLTGLDTRKLARIRNSESFRRPLYSTKDFLKELTPESCIVETWSSSPIFTDSETKQPLVIEMWGAQESFETLVKESVKARGITVKSVLESMQRSNLLKIRKDGRIELASKDVRPKELRERIGNIQIGLDAAGRLLGTVCHNLEVPSREGNKYFQRSSWTYRINPNDLEKLQQVVRDYLVEFDDGARNVVRQFEEDTVSDGQVMAGVGAYYFQSEGE